MRKPGILFSTLFLPVILLSQTFENDMKRVYEHFYLSENISYKIQYILKQTHDAGSRVISTNHGSYIRFGDAVKSTFEDKMSLSRSNIVVSLDEASRQMTIKSIQETSPINIDFLSQLNSYNSLIDRTTCIYSGNGSKTYRVVMKEEESLTLLQYDLTINLRNNSLERMVLYYKSNVLQENYDYRVSGSEKPSLEIRFSEIRTVSSQEKILLEPSYYYTRSANKILPTLKFKEYEVFEIQ